MVQTLSNELTIHTIWNSTRSVYATTRHVSAERGESGFRMCLAKPYTQYEHRTLRYSEK